MLAGSYHPGPVYRYLITHWRGQQSLVRSFWINLVLLRVLVFNIQSLLAPEDGGDLSQWRVMVAVLTLVFHGLLLLWQIVGVIRAADHHFSWHGNMALVWGAQLGATLMFILSAVYALAAVQMTQPAKQDERRWAELMKQRKASYQLLVSADSVHLNVNGSLEPGITRAVEQLLELHPSIAHITLNSSGGNVFEGRGLSRLFAKHKLTTHVSELCASACTIAYIGGSWRSANRQARLGFHQYRLDADYLLVVTSPALEQGRDKALFLQAGVAEGFVNAMFEKTPETMWWPALHELQVVGVIHELL